MARYLVLSDNSLTVVDDNDYPELRRYRWRRLPSGYVVRNVHVSKKSGLTVKWATIYMHRWICRAELEADASLQVDHLDGDRANNRRSNLSVKTRSAHYRRHRVEQGPRKGPWKGVQWNRHDGRWVASICRDGRNVRLGSWPLHRLDDALLARDLAALREYGPKTYLNKPAQLEGLDLATAAAPPAPRADGRRTHCPRGHLYEGENLYVDPKGERHCRACRTAMNAARYALRKAELRRLAA